MDNKIVEVDNTVEVDQIPEENTANPKTKLPEYVTYTDPETGEEYRYVPESKLDDYHRLQDQYEKCDASRLMALADMENMRKRFNRDLSAIQASQGKDMFNKLCPVFNNIYTVMTSAERMDDATPLRSVWNDTVKTLASVNITIVEPTIGEEFNTDTMAAVMSVDVPEGEGLKPGTVALVLSPAYKMGDATLKYANVAVVKSAEQ